MKTSNPAFGPNAYPRTLAYRDIGSPMTIAGTINRTGILLLLTMATAAWVWNQFLIDARPEHGRSVRDGWSDRRLYRRARHYLQKKLVADYNALVYAVLEGLFLGAVCSVSSRSAFPASVLRPWALTFGTCICMLRRTARASSGQRRSL